MTRLTLIFSYGVSLKTWNESGFLSREVSYYEDLVAKGILVQFLTYGDSSDHDVPGIPNNIEIIPIYEKRQRPKSKILAFLDSLLVPTRFKDELGSSDILKSNQIWGSWVAVVAKFVHKKPLLIRAGYDLYKNALLGEKNKLKLLFIWLISRLAYRSADHVWLPTKEISEFVISKHCIKPVNVTIYPNWVDTELFSSIDASVAYPNRVLYIGRLSAEKNVSLLLNALAQTDVSLDIVGDGELKDSLHMEALQLSVEVRFLGRIPNSSLPEAINKYPIVVLCSNFEGSPKTLLESMSCGKAVIGTNSPGINNVISHNENGLLCDSNAIELRAAILELCQDGAKRQRLGLAARKMIMADNSKVEAITKELLVYNKLLSQRH